VKEGIATAAKARNLDTIMKNYPRGDTLVVFDVVPPRQYVGYDTFRKDWQRFSTCSPTRSPTRWSTST
jgi:hypothetical protein